MKKGTLYEDTKLKITYLLDNKGKIASIEDHELHFLTSGNRHLIGRGILRQLAHASRSDLENSLKNINPKINGERMQESLSFEAVGLALAQAYIRELEKQG